MCTYMCMLAKLLQSCLSLCNPMDKNPPRSSVYEILQARILEWVAVSSSRGSSQARGPICIIYNSWISRQVLNYSCRLRSPCVCVCVCVYIYIYIQFFYFSWVTTCMYFFSNTNIKMQNPYFCILLFRFNLSKYFGDCSKPYIYITF